VGFTHLCVAHKKSYVEKSDVKESFNTGVQQKRYIARNLTGNTSHPIF
jgi:hypothetical protein